ncbi:Prefoldin [Chiua virens]|nr:Prefoldin [Chiua virens]
MSTLSDDTLRKILVQIQQTAVQSQRALNLAKQQSAAKERERRIVQLTISEIATIEGDVNLYKGVGKMFMMVPQKTMEQELKGQEKELTEDINNLNKKSKFLEKQFNDAQAQLRDIVGPLKCSYLRRLTTSNSSIIAPNNSRSPTSYNQQHVYALLHLLRALTGS